MIGLTFTVAYTNSKSIGNNFESATGEVGGQNSLYNPNYNRALSTNDVPQRLVFGYMYEIPVGKRRQFLSSGLVGNILGNWQVSGVTTKFAASSVKSVVGLIAAGNGQDPGLQHSRR